MLQKQTIAFGSLRVACRLDCLPKSRGRDPRGIALGIEAESPQTDDALRRRSRTCSEEPDPTRLALQLRRRTPQ